MTPPAIGSRSGRRWTPRGLVGTREIRTRRDWRKGGCFPGGPRPPRPGTMGRCATGPASASQAQSQAAGPSPGWWPRGPGRPAGAGGLQHAGPRARLQPPHGTLLPPPPPRRPGRQPRQPAVGTRGMELLKIPPTSTPAALRRTAKQRSGLQMAPARGPGPEPCTSHAPGQSHRAPSRRRPDGAG